MRKVLYILGGLEDGDIDWMLASGSRQRAPAGTMLIQEGVTLDAIYFVTDGAFDVRSGAGGQTTVARLYRGEIIGELSFLDARPPSASVVAVQDSQVFAIPRDAVSQRLGVDTGFAARFYRALGVFLASRLRETVGQLAYGDARVLDEDVEAEDELDLDLLDNTALASARFEWMLKRLAGA